MKLRHFSPLFALTAAVWLLGAPTTARAQAPGAQMTMPTLVKIHQIPVGAWSRYNITIPGQPGIAQELAVVSRNEKTTAIQVTMSGGPMARVGEIVVLAEVASDPKSNHEMQRLVMKLGGQDAMEMPMQMQQAQSPIQSVDPSKLQGKPTVIKVPAGTFTARRFENTSNGSKFVAWLSEAVAPFGLVKMEGQTGGGTFTVELQARGNGAKAKINPAATKPFDPQAFMKLMGAMSGGAGASGPSAGAPPAGTRKPKAQTK